MASLFVGPNVSLRFLTNDDPAKAKRAETLFDLPPIPWTPG